MQSPHIDSERIRFLADAIFCFWFFIVVISAFYRDDSCSLKYRIYCIRPHSGVCYMIFLCKPNAENKRQEKNGNASLISK